MNNSLFTGGKKFFEQIQSQNFLGFICDLENNNEDKVLTFLENHVQLAVDLASTQQFFPALREKIINKLPDDGNILKEKLLLLLKYDEKDYAEVLRILGQLDLSKLDFQGCLRLLPIIHQVKAWDYEIILLEKLIEKESSKKEKFSLEIQLFNSYQNIKNFLEVMAVGEHLLLEDSVENHLDIRDKEVLLTYTIYACLERGKIDVEAYNKAKEILVKYQLKKPIF